MIDLTIDKSTLEKNIQKAKGIISMRTNEGYGGIGNTNFQI